MPFSNRPLRAIAIAMSLTIINISTLTIAKAEDVQSELNYYQVNAGALDAALAQFGQQSGLLISINGNVSQNKVSSGLDGTFTSSSALTELLHSTGLQAVAQGNGSYIITESVNVINNQYTENELNLDKLNIIAEEYVYTRDEKGYDDLYEKNMSTSFIGKHEIERYKGSSPADLLQGISGVFSGEARNSSALDVNIRGVQGPGRVPVAIDGTEQALTVWRGYNGATNRSYIDPNLIGNIQIYKGSGVVRDVNTGIGGAMVVSTLNPDDIIRPGENFGAELKIEGSNNTVSERIPKLHTGEDLRDGEDFPNNYSFNDQTLIVEPRSGGSDYNVFSGEDYAYRLAVAKKTDAVDILAAYAYRQRGNYFSGKNNIDYYNTDQADTGRDYITSMANFWLPGEEVLNTSSRMESWLLKSTFHLAEDQELEFGFRDSRTVNGEIMSSRISRFRSSTDQWPLSNVDAKAYNLQYTFKPEDNRWVDLHASIWRTDTDSNTYSRGGYPNDADYIYNSNTDTGSGDPMILNSAITHAKNTRNGINISNKINLSSTLDLTLGSKFEREKQRSDDEKLEYASAMYPREGRRQQWEFDFDTAWRPFESLEINGGMRYSSFWSFDDYLNDHEGEITSYQTQYYDLTYDVEHEYTAEERQAVIDNQLESYQLLLDMGLISQAVFDAASDNVRTNTPSTYTTSESTRWEPDEDGNYDRATNACLNGTLDKESASTCNAISVNEEKTLKAERKKDHGWVPHFGATLHFNDHNRIYVRYAEDLRYPSLFESTIGFSAQTSQFPLKPEHNYNWEAAYISDLTQWLPDVDYADIKIAYYHSLTRDVIDRDDKFEFNNIDKQTIRGLELSGRYDTGRFFTDFGLNYTLENEVCDESYAATLSSNSISVAQSNPIPKCMKYGFPGSYLLTQAAPELSINWSLGGRFLNKKLEVGSRITYYKKYKNKDLEWYESHASSGATLGYVYSFNIPFSWGNTTIVDAYARYNVNNNVSVELVGNNLTNQYYVDPATRSAMPAPGRTLKLSLTARF